MIEDQLLDRTATSKEEGRIAGSDVDQGRRPKVGLYERFVRRSFLYLLGLVATVPAVLVGLPVFVINAIVHRGIQRAFFAQERVGHRGRRFVILKFRTMRGTAEDGPDRARVTRLGRLLRSTHLDELPQVWNLVRRDMTLIGPRPEMVCIHEWAIERIPGYEQRLEQVPGLTGLAQITQGYTAAGDEVAYTRKSMLDARYAAKITLRGDLTILMRTVFWVLRGRGWLARVSPSRQAPRQSRRNRNIAA